MKEVNFKLVGNLVILFNWILVLFVLVIIFIIFLLFLLLNEFEFDEL